MFNGESAERHIVAWQQLNKRQCNFFVKQKGVFKTTALQNMQLKCTFQ